MKLTLFIAIIIFQISCTNYAPQGNQYSIKGYIDVPSGEGKLTKTQYTLQEKDSMKFKNKVSFEELKRLSLMISKESMNQCKYELTYEPIEISMFYDIKGNYDTLYSSMTFSAKNSFGVSDKISKYYTIVNGKIIKIN